MGNLERALIGVSLILAAVATAAAAEISVPLLEMATTGSVEDGDFVLGTRAEAEIAVTGGYKYGGTLRFAFSADDLEKALYYSKNDPETAADGSTVTSDEYNSIVDRMKNSAALSFRLAKVDIRDPFGAPIELSYFVGEAATFCSGDDFTPRFGTASIGSDFRGFAYFPNGIDGNPDYQYDGIHSITGTGISIAATAFDSVVPILYAYQDSAFGSEEMGRYSADFRLLINGEFAKIEAFAGVTAPYGDSGLYRGGVLAHFSTGTGPEFMAQIGVPRWDPDEEFGIDNLYVLFEPRVDFGLVSIVMTLFYHPAWYLQQETNERGASDINVKLLFGDVRESALEGGIETTIGVKGKDQEDDDAFRLSVGPFIAAATEGVRWDLKVKAHPFDYSDSHPAEFIDVFLGVRTAF